MPHSDHHGALTDSRCFTLDLVKKIGTRQSSILSCHDNRLPTTHQLHAATPPLLDLLAALHWTQSGINCSSKALTCTDCKLQTARTCFRKHRKSWTCCCFAENGSALICQLRGLVFLIWSAQGPDLLQVHTVDQTVPPPSSIALLGSVCLKAAALLHFSCLNPKPCFVGVTPCIHELGWYTHTHTHTCNPQQPLCERPQCRARSLCELA